VKVLDFGLAKAMDSASGSRLQASGEPANSPTITSPAQMTGVGVILGTAAYMAPEQARGTAVDKRADVWAFGVVLHEMLTGQRLFAGATMSDTIAAVLKSEPAGTPPSIRKLLRRCLEKDRKRRLTDAGAARLEIDDALTASPAVEGASDSGALAARATWRGRLPWMVATAAVAGMAALAFPALSYLQLASPAAPPEMRVEITTPATDAPLQFALSPDGRMLVFVASGDGAPRLWLRSLDETEARPLSGTEGGINPFWSPDSRSVGFFARNRLMRLDVAGGALQELAPTVGINLTGSWSADGTILFPRLPTAGPLLRVSAAGGEPVALTRLDPPRQVGHGHPHFLPDGQHFLFATTGTPDSAGLYLGSLDGNAPARLTAADSGGAFLPPNWVVFVQQGTLVARQLDLARGVLIGDPAILADRVGVGAYGHGGFAVSTAGEIAYRTGGDAARQLMWVDRTGKAMAVAGEPDASDLRFPELSLDGRRVALDRVVQGNRPLAAGSGAPCDDPPDVRRVHRHDARVVARRHAARVFIECDRHLRSLREAVERVRRRGPPGDLAQHQGAAGLVGRRTMAAVPRDPPHERTRSVGARHDQPQRPAAPGREHARSGSDGAVLTGRALGGIPDRRIGPLRGGGAGLSRRRCQIAGVDRRRRRAALARRR
jgi:eukaryotic-like serine/threonine-protein kinase